MSEIFFLILFVLTSILFIVSIGEALEYKLWAYFRDKARKEQIRRQFNEDNKRD